MLGGILTACGNNATETSNTTEAKENVTETIATVAEDTDAAKGGVIELGADEMPMAGATPMVIDCWATWCGPCMQFKPVFHKTAIDYADKAIFMAADIDVCTSLKDKYQISAIPTVIILKASKDPIIQTGSMNEDEFKTFLDTNL